MFLSLIRTRDAAYSLLKLEWRQEHSPAAFTNDLELLTAQIGRGEFAEACLYGSGDLDVGASEDGRICKDGRS
jgi:hypothetical protein